MGAAALIGFALVARVSLPGPGVVERAIVRSHAGNAPAAIVLPTPSPREPAATTGATTAAAGSGFVATSFPTPTTGLDVTSPSVAPAPIDDFGIRPAPNGLRPPSLAGRDALGGGGGEGEGKALGHAKRASDERGAARYGDDDGWTAHRAGTKARSYSDDHGSKAAKPSKASKPSKSSDDGAKKGLGHTKSKGKGHSKHSHDGRH